MRDNRTRNNHRPIDNRNRVSGLPTDLLWINLHAVVALGSVSSCHSDGGALLSLYRFLDRSSSFIVYKDIMYLIACGSIEL